MTLRNLKIKLLPLFLIALSFLFLPGNSYYETLALVPRPPQTAALNFDLPSLPSLPQARFDLSLDLSAKAALLLDFNSGMVLYDKNSKAELPPASLTKIMTAIIVLENFSDDDLVTISEVENYGQVVGLIEGEQITVKNLLYGLLIPSGNDAAYALADFYPGGRDSFVAAMNEKAKSLGMENTLFVNPNGQYDLNHYSTAEDLARLTMYAWRQSEFQEVVGYTEKLICDINGQICHPLVSTNELLGVFPGALGVKTGWTEESEGCFVGFFDEDGRRLLSVILGSQDRFQDTQKLVGWGLINFSYSPLTQVESIAGK